MHKAAVNLKLIEITRSFIILHKSLIGQSAIVDRRGVS